MCKWNYITTTPLTHLTHEHEQQQAGKVHLYNRPFVHWSRESKGWLAVGGRIWLEKSTQHSMQQGSTLKYIEEGEPHRAGWLPPSSVISGRLVSHLARYGIHALGAQHLELAVGDLAPQVRGDGPATVLLHEVGDQVADRQHRHGDARRSVQTHLPSTTTSG